VNEVLQRDTLAHLERAQAYVDNREGSYASYAREHGIAITTFHQWMQAFGSDTQMQQRKETKSFVKVGKPKNPMRPRGERKSSSPMPANRMKATQWSICLMNCLIWRLGTLIIGEFLHWRP